MMSMPADQPIRREDDTPEEADSASPDETLGDANDAPEDIQPHGTPAPPPKRKGGRKPVCTMLICNRIDCCRWLI